MYTDFNFQTKKALKEAVASGKKVTIYQPGPFGGDDVKDGKYCVEGPHYPQPHKWYAQVVVENGYVVKVS